MRVEIAFEAEASSEKLEIPWENPASGARYVDLREDAKAMERIEEARRYLPLRTFLAAVNSADSLFSTARAKTWTQEEASASAASAAGGCEFASQVDLVFAPEQLIAALGHYENLTQRLYELLAREPGSDTLRAELRVRPCRFRATAVRGFSLAILLFARGASPEQAELRWGLGLARVQQALLFTSRVLRQQITQAS